MAGPNGTERDKMGQNPRSAVLRTNYTASLLQTATGAATCNRNCETMPSQNPASAHPPLAPDEGPRNKAAVVRSLMPQLTRLRAAGYTFDQIAASLSQDNFSISPATLRRLFNRAKPASIAVPSTAPSAPDPPTPQDFKKPADKPPTNQSLAPRDSPAPAATSAAASASASRTDINARQREVLERMQNMQRPSTLARVRARRAGGAS